MAKCKHYRVCGFRRAFSYCIKQIGEPCTFYPEKEEAPAPNQTETERIDVLAAEVCERYCVYPYRLDDQEMLDKMCEHCPVNELVRLAKRE